STRQRRTPPSRTWCSTSQSRDGPTNRTPRHTGTAVLTTLHDERSCRRSTYGEISGSPVSVHTCSAGRTRILHRAVSAYLTGVGGRRPLRSHGRGLHGLDRPTATGQERAAHHWRNWDGIRVPA